MEDHRFDAWTRRRFGLASGGLLATLAGFGTDAGTDAKPDRKPKKCTRKEVKCGKKCVKGECCPGKACDEACTCQRTTSGATACLSDEVFLCDEATACSKNSDCGRFGRCVPSDCPSPKNNVCVARCLHMM